MVYQALPKAALEIPDNICPHLADLPSIQQSRTDPNIEELIKLEPDVVFTMDEQLAEA